MVGWYHVGMSRRLLPAVLLALYSALLIIILVLKIASFKIGHLRLNFSGYATGEPNLVPFTTIMPYLSGERGQMIGLFNIGGNIALFIPFGFLLPFVFRTVTWRTVLALAIGIPLVIEITQEVFHIGIFDIDDVILNGLGMVLGYFAFVLLTLWKSSR